MKERGILFSAPMVRALLDGSKTQTRRALRVQPPEDCATISTDFFHPTVIDRRGDEQPGTEMFGAYTIDGEWGMKCPYGPPGDRLWVRETFRGPLDDDTFGYRATHSGPFSWETYTWRPSIFMPRIASRITLEVTDVRVERLNDISRGDAMDEGCPFPNMADGIDPREWYADVWEGINGAGSWAANPWVWALTFKRIDAAPQGFCIWSTPFVEVLLFPRISDCDISQSSRRNHAEITTP